MNTELIEKLATENAMLVESLKAVYHQNWLTKIRLKKSAAAARVIVDRISTVEADRNHYKELSESSSKSNSKYEEQIIELQDDNKMLSKKNKKKAIAVVLLCVFLLFVSSFSVWLFFREFRAINLAKDIHSSIPKDTIFSKYIPDTLRYEYECLINEKW